MLEAFICCCLYCFIVAYTYLFPDAKLTKNIVQKVIGCDLAGDLAQKVQGPADIHGQEIIGDLLVQAGNDVQQGLPGLYQAVVMPDVGDHRVACAESVQIYQLQNF